MLPKGRSYKYGDLKENQVYVGEEIIAPFTFAINKTEEELKRDRQRAEDGVLPAFTKNDSLSDDQLASLNALFDSLATVSDKGSTTSIQVKEVTRILQTNNIEYTDENLSPGKHWYYLRVIQDNGEMAWSSPIWVTFEG